MLSRESLLLAWNSGCLNSHACEFVITSLRIRHGGKKRDDRFGRRTYTRSVGIDTIILVILANLVEIVFIQLPNERCEIAVFEVFR